MLVGFLRVEDCQQDWRTIKFEIVAALALKDWKRARELYQLAENHAVLPAPVLYALRAQLSFLIATHGGSNEEVFDSPEWEPRFIGSRDVKWATGTMHASDKYPAAVIDRLQFLQLILICLQTDKSDWKPSPEARELFRLPVLDLERAFDNEPSFPDPYRCMLARSYFELEDFANAAKHFHTLVQLRDPFQVLDENLSALGGGPQSSDHFSPAIS